MEPVGPQGLLATDLQVTKYFGTKKIKESEGVLGKLKSTLELTGDVGRSKERTSLGGAGTTLVSSALIFTGTTAEVGFKATGLGVVESINRRGFVNTIEDYTFAIPRATIALSKGELLRSPTPAGKVSEALGIGTGIYLGGKVNKLTIKGIKGTKEYLGKVSRELRAPDFKPQVGTKVPSPRPQGQGQTKFSVTTESGKEIPQFGEKFPQITRVVANKKTGTIKSFYPLRTPLKGGAKNLKGGETQLKILTSGKTDLIKVKIDATGKTTKVQKINVPKPTQPTKPLGAGKQSTLQRLDTLDDLDASYEFRVPQSKPSFLKAFFRSKKGSQALLFKQKTEISIGGSDLSLDTPTGQSAPIGSLVLVPPLTEPKTESDFGSGFILGPDKDIDSDRDREVISPPILEDFNINKTPQKIDSFSISKPGTIYETINDFKIDTDLDKDQGTDITQDIKQDQDQDRDLVPDLDFTQDFKEIQDPPKEREFTLPAFKFEKTKKTKSNTEPLFYVKAKEKGRYVKLNKKPLPRNKALNLGGFVVDNSTSATFKVIKAKKRGKVRDDFSFFKSSKFKQKNNTYTERNTHRIDTRGEVLGLSIAKVLKGRTLNF